MNNHFSIKEVVSYGFTQAWHNLWFFAQATALMIVIIAGLTLAGLFVNGSFIAGFDALQKKIAVRERELRGERGALTQEQSKEIAVLSWEGFAPLIKEHWLALLMSFLVCFIVLCGLLAGAITLALRFHDTNAKSLSDLASGFYVLPKFLGAGLLVGCMMLVFCILFMATTAGAAMLISDQNSWGRLLVIGLVSVPLSCIGFYVMIRLFFVWFALVDNHGVIAAFKHSWAITKGHFWHIVLLNLLGGLFSMVSLLRVPLLIFPVDLMFARTYRILEQQKS